MDIRVISLKNSSRREYIQKTLKDLDIDATIFDAVDGSKIRLENYYEYKLYKVYYENEKYFYNTGLRLSGEFLKLGEMGCSLSHIKLYKEFLKSPSDYLLIFEDDVQPLCNKETIHFYLDHLPDPKSFDLCTYTKSEWYPLINEEKFDEYYYIPIKNIFNRSASYIVTKRGANKLLNSCYPYFGVMADDLLSNTFICDDNFIMIIPLSPLFQVHPDIKSDVETINNNKSL